MQACRSRRWWRRSGPASSVRPAGGRPGIGRYTACLCRTRWSWRSGCRFRGCCWSAWATPTAIAARGCRWGSRGWRSGCGTPAAMRVEPVDTRPGPVTASTVLQTPTGQRHWLLPPPTTPREPLDLAGAQWLYVDLYDEIEDYLIDQLHKHPADADRRLIVNLSSSRPLDKARGLADLRPFLVQSSHHGPGTLPDAAAALRDAASSSYAVATAGPAGAALASATGRHLTTPRSTKPKVRLGAGAAFSAGLVSAALAGADEQGLLDAAAHSATAWLTEEPGGSR